MSRCLGDEKMVVQKKTKVPGTNSTVVQVLPGTRTLVQVAHVHM